MPVLHGYSRHVGPVPADWPPHAEATGFWFLDRPTEWQPSPALVSFLESGPPPVYVGFGSMTGNRAQERAHLVITALERAGVRGVMASGWGGLNPGNCPSSVHLIDEVPHDWLFPRMAAVVHHGGAGTTAAGLRAGRPTVICPFMADQPFWGRCVHERGFGPAPIPQKKLTVENLAAAIREAVNDPAMREKAATVGHLLRAETGVENAVMRLEEIARHSLGS
jgi:sterol 3beta-glucosyltransferase